jgi:hypothetical protein
MFSLLFVMLQIKYGLKGIVSTRGDVYSYGILLMETFTRKKPTNDTFGGEINLKRWVEESLPLSVTKVINAFLLRGLMHNVTPCLLQKGGSEIF